MPPSFAHRSALALALMLGGCTLAGQTPVAYVKRGPASPHDVRRVVALPAVVTPPSEAMASVLPLDDAALKAFERAIGSSVRMDLELYGLVLVDAESLNGTLRHRIETSVHTTEPTAGDSIARPSPLSFKDTVSVSLGEGAFLTSSREVQDEVLTTLAVDSRLDSRLEFGPIRGPSMAEPTIEQAVSVELVLTSRRDERRVARSVCSADAGAQADYGEAVERATRCAISGLLIGLGLSEEGAR